MIGFHTFIPSLSSTLLKSHLCEPRILLVGVGWCPLEDVQQKGRGPPQKLCVHRNVCHNSLVRLFSLRLMKPSSMITQEGGVEVWGQKINVDDFISSFSQALSSLKS